MPAKRHNKKSRNWAKNHVSDHYVREARQKGYRARSAFKLEEIDKKYSLIKPRSKVVDLGAAPGSWSQYASSRIAPDRSMIAVDMLEMKPIDKVIFIQGDFTKEETQGRLMDTAENAKFDLVLSDMAPNITGIRITDQGNIEYLQNCIFRFCIENLNLGGNLLSKYFEGESSKEIKLQYQSCFDEIHIIKPDASRSKSKEIYLFGRQFLGQAD